MKKILLVSLLLSLFIIDFNFAQEGRPQYNIRNERAGEYIGDIVIELFPYVAPLHVANFDSLVSISFYDSTAWHRVVPDFVIQGGDPNSINGPRSTWGEGDSTQATVPAEFSKVSHLRGIIGAARDTDINSATSQFYINTVDNTGLDGNYTAYGIVVEGMDVVEDIESSPRDNNDNPFDKIEMFITKIGVNESVPDVPQMIEPIEGFVGLKKTTDITWSEVEGAVLTFLEISSDSNFTNIAFADSFAVTGEGSTSVKFPDVEIGSNKYYWRVRSNNGAKFSDYSEARSFTSAINSPVLISPENNSTDVSVNTLLDWEPVEGAVSYKVEAVMSFPNFGEERRVINQSGISETELQVNNLEGNTRYYWRVLAEAAEHESPYSESWIFTTEDVTGVVDDKIPSSFNLSQNYPNPFNPVSIITFDIPKAVDVTIQVYDLTGSLISTLVNRGMQPGSYKVPFDGSELSSGVYYYRLKAGKFVDTKKMILVR